MCFVRQMLVMAGFVLLGVVHAQASYVSEVTADSPVGYWRFEDGSTTNPAANSGTAGPALNGTYVGAGTSLVSGLPGLGAAVAFDDSATTDDYVQVPHHNALNFTTAMTLEALIKTSDTSVRWARILDKAVNSGYTLNLVDRTGQVSTYAQIGGAARNVQSGRVVADGLWHHVATTYDGTALRLYVDGRLWGATPATGAIATNTHFLAIGINRSTSVNNEDFLGSVDEVAVYNHALPAERIAAHARAAGLADASLIINGSFEAPIVGSGLLDVNPGFTVGGWTQNAGGAKGHYLGTNWQAADGNQSYHLGAASGAGSISQQFPTTPGGLYALTFQSSGWHQAGAVQTGTVTAGDLNGTFKTPRGASTANMGWTAQGFTFRAETDTTTLTLASPGGTSVLGIDDVVAVQLIPRNLITNGSFEDPVVGSGLLDVNPGQTLGGWTQNTGGVKGHYLGTDWQAAEGNQSYHLGASAGAGSVSRSFATQPGWDYFVSFWASGYPRGDLADFQTGTISVGDLSTTFLTAKGTSQSDMGWLEHGFFFTATDSISTLTFGNVGGTGAITIDNVAVYGFIPEPHGAVLLGWALAGWLLVRRRRRKA